MPRKKTPESYKDFQKLSAKWPTIFELASQINAVPEAMLGKPGGTKGRPPVTQGMSPKPFPAREGYIVASPEMLLSLRVPKIEVGDEVRGFQREKVNSHARKIAKSMLDGDEMPPIFVSIFVDGQCYIDDGQHRALGAVIAGKPLEVITKKRTYDQARKLFANQTRAKKLKSDDTLLTGDSPLELYVQDACTNPDHPWAALVAPYKHPTKMTPTSMAQCVGPYGTNTLGHFTQRNFNENFDPKRADELALLIMAFGNKTTNELAFGAHALRAISRTATLVMQRNPNYKDGDIARWRRHMATFNFGKHPHLLRKQTELSLVLVEHWNKRLPEERRVNPAELVK